MQKHPDRQRWPRLRNVSLGVAVSAISMTTILASAGVVSFFASQILYENKLRDTWAIMYLELETKARQLAAALEAAQTSRATPAADHGADLVLRKEADGLIPVAGDGSVLPATELRLPGGKDIDPILVFKVAGQEYLGRIAAQPAGRGAGQLVYLWKTAIAPHLGQFKGGVDVTSVYVVNKQGQVLFANDPTISDATVLARPLVQSFAAAPFRQGQLEFVSADKQAMYGFYAEVDKTNLVMFAEIPKSQALVPVRKALTTLGGFIVLILVLALMFLQYPLALIVRPVRDLASLAGEVAQGRFQGKSRHSGFGELRLLTGSFIRMSESLAARDQRILALMAEQREKIRMDGELRIARSIQENLLPGQPFPGNRGLDVAASYVPASEVAGDWYHYVYSEASREGLFAILDVSGHGAGAAMFTTVTASIFADAWRSTASGASFDSKSVMQRLNHQFLTLGKGRWSASMVIAKIRADEESCELTIAGHPPPLLYTAQRQRIESPALRRGSPLLGIEAAVEPRVVRLPFAAGALLVMFTDGFFLPGDPGKKARFGRKDAMALLQGMPGVSSERINKRLHSEWSAKLAGAAAADDLCLLTVRAA
jgi:serine phosphatase RsbU (regulator of sigma subunit)